MSSPQWRKYGIKIQKDSVRCNSDNRERYNGLMNRNVLKRVSEKKMVDMTKGLRLHCFEKGCTN